MVIEGESGSDLARWVAAFPGEMAGDVELVVRAMPAGSVAKPAGSRLSPSTTDSDRHPVGILIDGESIAIPARMYNDKIRPGEAPVHLDARQRLILGCVYTRHHDGYVRQRWAREVVTADDSFVVPFVLQLLGEYVVEIITDLCRGLTALDYPDLPKARAYGRFLADNPGFLFLTRQRVASYWACYHRGRYMRPQDYPGHVLLIRLDQVARRSRDYAHPTTSNAPHQGDAT